MFLLPIKLKQHEFFKEYFSLVGRYTDIFLLDLNFKHAYIFEPGILFL